MHPNITEGPKSSPPPPPVGPQYVAHPVGVPPMIQSQGPPVGQWTTGLCGCCEDPANCFVTCCCPCIVFGQNAEIIDRNTTSCCCAGLIFYCLCHYGCACFYSCTFRGKLRGQFSLPDSPCGDCLVHCCCNYCAICQEYRELKNRGLDPSIGWVANAERVNRVTMTPPVVIQGMPR